MKRVVPGVRHEAFGAAILCEGRYYYQYRAVTVRPGAALTGSPRAPPGTRQGPCTQRPLAHLTPTALPKRHHCLQVTGRRLSQGAVPGFELRPDAVPSPVPTETLKMQTSSSPNRSERLNIKVPFRPGNCSLVSSLTCGGRDGCRGRSTANK